MGVQQEASQPHWSSYAECRTELGKEFYPFPENKRESNISKSVCKACPVELECLAYAFFTKSEDGFFGGRRAEQRVIMGRIMVISRARSEEETLLILRQYIDG